MVSFEPYVRSCVLDEVSSQTPTKAYCLSKNKFNGAGEISASKHLVKVIEDCIWINFLGEILICILFTLTFEAHAKA